MKIRSKTITVVVATLVVLVVALSFSLQAVMTSGFQRVERADTEKNMNRVLDTVRAEIDGIGNSITTWAQWDASYDFVQGKAPTFVKDNISKTVYTGMKINYLLFVKPDGRVVLGGGYDAAKGKSLPVPTGLRKLLVPGNKLLATTDVNEPVKGIVVVDGTPLMLVSAPITGTAANKPRAGYVIFAKLLDAAEAKRLSGIAHMIVSFDQSYTSIGGILVSPENDSIIQGKTALRDIYGKPVLTSTIENPRNIYQEGKRDLSYMVGSLVVAGAVFGIVILTLLEFVVVRRAVKLSNEVTSITESMAFDRQVTINGSDEITSLGTSVNGLLAAVSEVVNSVAEAA